jgi:hypothetical protein
MKRVNSSVVISVLLGAVYAAVLGGVAWLFARYVPYGTAWFVALITVAAFWNPRERHLRKSRLKPVSLESTDATTPADAAAAESRS